MLVIMAPVLGLVAFTALLALAAGLAGWRRQEMLTTAAAAGVLVGAVALMLLILRIGERSADRRALHVAQARVGGILESAMDAIITVDEAQRVVLFNAAAEAVFGCPRAAALGAPLARFIPERFRSEHADHVRRFGDTGTSSRRMGAQRIVTGLRRNGEEFPIDASISHTAEEGNRFFTVILRDVTERVRAEEALRRSREELREMSQASNSVREHEKTRIARELHDELGQSLTALKLDVGWLRERLKGEAPEVQGKLQSMQSQLDHTVAATRRISTDLRPLMLDDLGFVPAAEWLVRNFTQRSGIACALQVLPPELALQDPEATALYRILQESLTNVARHANATRVEARVEQIGSEIMLRVSDNGRGFSAAESRKQGSYGLLGLRERVYLVGGRLDIDSSPGAGTRITVHIPARGEVPA
jgi:PAS domain S-box-containing protein